MQDVKTRSMHLCCVASRLRDSYNLAYCINSLNFEEDGSISFQKDDFTDSFNCCTVVWTSSTCFETFASFQPYKYFYAALSSLQRVAFMWRYVITAFQQEAVPSKPEEICSHSR